MASKTGSGPDQAELPETYRRACRLALREQYDKARRLYLKVEATADPGLVSIIAHDLAVLAALSGDLDASRIALKDLLASNSGCEPARLNAAFLEAEGLVARPGSASASPTSLAPPPCPVRRERNRAG